MVTVVNGDQGCVLRHAGQRLVIPASELPELAARLNVLAATSANTASDTPLISTADDPRRVAHAQAVQHIQTLLDQIRYQYADSTRAFVALHTVWQATRAAWYAVRYEQVAHLAELAEAVDWVAATGEPETE